ncbi:hypothetical protein ACKWTF_001407 [Chironomus riparius]
MLQEPKYIIEGSAQIFEEGNVFYNPVQEFNRDVSICVLNTFMSMFREELLSKKERVKKNEEPKPPKKIRVLEALAATGLRSIRYAKEVEGLDEIIANDLMNQAVNMINKNVKANGVEDKVTTSHADAVTLMYTTKPDNKFTVIDLDPYGGPNRFLDGAVQSVVDGGLLLITATDMAVLAGNTPEACIVKYGSVPLRSKACHEMALRILIRSVETTANRYGRYIKPLLCLSIDFYVRVFVRIFTGQFQCKESSTKQSMVYQCTGCDAFTLQPLAIRKSSPENPKSIKFCIPTGPFVSTNCEHCGHKHHMGGPIWNSQIHDWDFLGELLKFVKSEKGQKLGTYNRILGVLSVVQEELPEIPLYYTIDQMCCVLKLEVVPQMKMRSAILHENYRVSLSHACKNSIKTDAPISLLWDILRSWAKTHPVNPARFHDGTALKKILATEPAKDYNFDDLHPQANPPSRKDALARYPENPAAMWGPGTRSTIMVDKSRMTKNIRNQNKNVKRKAKQRKNNEMKEEREKSPDTKHMKIDDEENNMQDVEVPS